MRDESTDNMSAISTNWNGMPALRENSHRTTDSVASASTRIRRQFDDHSVSLDLDQLAAVLAKILES
jgi:hypothetical protein